MTIRGKFGVPRPFAEQQLEVNFMEGKVELNIRGPFGVKRLFAAPNPGVTDDEVAVCMQGEMSNDFIQGVIENSPQPPSTQEEAIEWQRAYCEGVLEAMKTEEQGPTFPLPDDLRRALESVQAEEGEVIEVESEIVPMGETLPEVPEEE